MSTIPISPVPNVTKEVASKFHSLRQRFMLTHFAIAVFLAFAGWMLTWLGLALVDYVLEVQFSLRQLAMFSAIVIALLFALVRLAQHVRNCRVRAFASLLEHAFTSFGQRIRTVLDTVDGKVSGPPEMLAALGHQTLGRWETLVPTQILPKRLLATSLTLCAITGVVVLFSLQGESEWKTAMLRSIGYEIPYTTLSVDPGNLKVLEGKDVAVSLKLIGRQNRDVQLRYKVVTDSSDWIVSDLEPKENGDFSFEFGKANDAIDYQFLTSVGDTDVFRINVQPLIVAVRTDIHAIPPSYTGLEPRTFSATEATVLERSIVNIRVETNHRLKTVHLEVGEKMRTLAPAPAAIGPAGNELTFELPTTTSLHWSLNATGEDGTPMTPLKGRLRVRQDAAPSIRWQDPQDEIRVHTLAELPMRAQVTDDYGVVETGIMFRIGDDEEFELTRKSIGKSTIESNNVTTSLLLDELLPLESFALTEQDYVSYYAFAIDNREWGNQRVETDVRYIDIRPLRQFFSEIELDPNANGGNRVLVQLDEIIRRQRSLISRTRKMEKSGESQATESLKVIDRMVQAESELAGLTRFLAEFFVSQGSDDVESLNQAEASMLQASDSMSAMNLSLALTQEEDALRALAEARRELEVILVKSNRAQQQQLSQIARQLQQKLRRDKKQTEQQLVDTLERIANEQMQLSEQVGGAAQSKASQSTPPVGEMSERDQREEWFSRQVELLERVQSIEEQLSSRLETSKLMAERMREVKAEMDALAKMARAGEQEPFQAGSRDVSDQLRELSVQLAALAATEAVNRVASLRDMTLSMAEREHDLVDATERLALGVPRSPEKTDNQSASGVTDSATEAQTRAARRLARRAASIADVLATPSDMGDVAMSEVSESLEKFADSNEISDKLSQSQSLGEKMSEGSTEEDQEAVDAAGDSPSELDLAVERARDYVDAAAQLDSLYRQLVSPRIARLRQLEQQASLLNQELGLNQESGRRAEKTENSMTTQGKVGQLQRELKQEGMGELAEVLDQSFEEPIGPGQSRYALTNRSTVQSRVEYVVKELRDQIQELILLEVAADRDAPVPAVYRSAVDGYFRTIAGESEEE